MLKVNQIKNLIKLKIFCTIGNAGNGTIGENININLDNFNEIYNFIKIIK